MKKKITKIALSSLSVFLFLFLIGSCSKDDDSGFGNFDLVQLDNVLSEARALLTNSEEGINAGDFQPGSKAILESIVNWVEKRKGTSKSQEDINDAILKLQAGIDTFLASTVSSAIPWVKQTLGTGIQISDNIKSVLDGPSTIELQVYAVDLNQAGFSNNLLAMVEGPANGFGVRYFGDGLVEIYAGVTTAWPEAESPAGTMKGKEWVNVAFTNTGSRQELYINGELVASQDVTYSVATNAPFTIGNSPTWTDRVSNALYREFKVWDTVLDQATIQTNIGAAVEGNEAGLECYFPLGSDLGTSFDDVTGNYTATLNGDVEWVSEPPVIVIDYSQIDAAIQAITDFRATVVEGDQDGDYPIGTISYIDELIANATDIRANDERQAVLDDTATSLSASITLINSTLVADTAGVYIDSEDPGAVGMRITPNYTPQGDYTYEFDLRLKTLELPQFGWGDIMGNGTIGFRVNGYQELTEENLLNAGGGWNWTNTGAFIGPMYPALTLKSAVWQHIAIVHDDTARTTKIFVDGVMVGESTDIGAPVVSGNLEIWLGNAFGAKMNGSIKDFRIWDSVRTEAELDMNITGSESDLQLYFPLDRVRGIKFADETGNYSGEMRGIIWNK